MKVTVDASVWVASYLPTDINHPAADQVIETLLVFKAQVIVPEIVLVEVAAGVARITQNSGQGQIASKRLEQFPGIRFRKMDQRLLELTTLLATNHFLRAADALYLATAKEAKAALITLDEETKSRSPSIVSALTPSEWLRQMAV